MMNVWPLRRPSTRWKEKVTEDIENSRERMDTDTRVMLMKGDRRMK
jgi:hypothetical protein